MSQDTSSTPPPALRCYQGRGPYGVSKHAVLCLTETLYTDLRAQNSALGTSVICPGFVDTNIVDAERNRPPGLATGANPMDPDLIAMGHAVLALGKNPDAVADEVFESIQRDSVYVLPNHAWDEVFLARIESIVARGAPLVVDQASIIDRTGAGEDF